LPDFPSPEDPHALAASAAAASTAVARTPAHFVFHTIAGSFQGAGRVGGHY
jgi:hypothetical protein